MPNFEELSKLILNYKNLNDEQKAQVQSLVYLIMSGWLGSVVLPGLTMDVLSEVLKSMGPMNQPTGRIGTIQGVTFGGPIMPSDVPSRVEERAREYV